MMNIIFFLFWFFRYFFFLRFVLASLTLLGLLITVRNIAAFDFSLETISINSGVYFASTDAMNNIFLVSVRTNPHSCTMLQ